MSRRSQVGSIEKTGKWYVVRFWKDVPGQEQRVHASERICPVSGPGSLNKSERKRRALQIVMSSGVNDPQKFAEATVGTTFKEQSERFMQRVGERKRRPVKPATLRGWQSYLDNWLNPRIGDIPLADINNSTAKKLVEEMRQKGLAAKTIVNCVGLLKMVVASAVDENGEQLFPRKWNHDFIDLPIVDMTAQRRPTFPAEVMTKIIEAADGQERVLYALLAGTGLRIGEALGLEVRHLSKDCRTITVEQSVWEGSVQAPKTKNAHRQIDVCPALADLLKTFVGDREAGFLFESRTGRPLWQSDLLRGSLHPILDKLKQPHTGFHAFRRFRVTWLRKQRVPEDLIRLWVGQAAQSVTDRYSRLDEDVKFRQSVAEQVGLGFEFPQFQNPIVRNVRKKSASVEIGVAA